MVEKDGENTKIRLNLAQNAIDSINRAIELIAWQEEPDEAKRLKQAVLSVAHGVELLLKERLRLVHPSLIWENVDKYPSTSARTVGVEIAVTRLKNIGGLTFSDADILLIRSLRDTRNAIEHYSWSTTSKEANSIIGKALGFAVSFSLEHLQYEFFGYYTSKDDTLSQLLETNTEFSKSYSEWGKQPNKVGGDENHLCDFCNALAVNPLNGTCRICGHGTIDDRFDDGLPF